MYEKDSFYNSNINILIPDLIMERIFNLLKSEKNEEVFSDLNAAIDLWFERKTELLKYEWCRKLQHMVLNKKNSITHEESIEFNFACMPTVYPEGLKYLGIGKINIPEWLNNNVKDSFLNLRGQKNKILAMLSPVKTSNDLKLYFDKYIDDFINGKFIEDYYNLEKHTQVFDEYINGLKEEGLKISFIKLELGDFMNTIFKIENRPDDYVLEFNETEKRKYRFIEFLFYLQNEGALKIEKFNTKLGNHPIYDSWEIVICYKLQNSKITEVECDNSPKSNYNKKYILRYYEINKSFVLDKKNLKLTPTETTILSIICSSPNQIQRPIKNNIRTHCCNINKKAKTIIETELITSSYNINNFSVIVKGLD